MPHPLIKKGSPLPDRVSWCSPVVLELREICLLLPPVLILKACATTTQLAALFIKSLFLVLGICDLVPSCYPSWHCHAWGLCSKIGILGGHIYITISTGTLPSTVLPAFPPLNIAGGQGPLVPTCVAKGGVQQMCLVSCFELAGLWDGSVLRVEV